MRRAQAGRRSRYRRPGARGSAPCQPALRRPDRRTGSARGVLPEAGRYAEEILRGLALLPLLGRCAPCEADQTDRVQAHAAFCPAGWSWRSRSSSVRLRSTARPRRLESTPMIVPTAVSRKTGATASWISRVTSMTFSGFTTGALPACCRASHHRFPQLVLEMVDVVERDL